MEFSFLFPFSIGSTLKGKNLLLQEQILSIKSRHHLQKALSSKKANRKSFFFLKMAQKYGPVWIHLELGNIFAGK